MTPDFSHSESPEGEGNDEEREGFPFFRGYEMVFRLLCPEGQGTCLLFGRFGCGFGYHNLEQRENGD